MTASDLAAALNVHPLVAEILIERGCDTVEAARGFLYSAEYQPASPFDLPDVALAAERLQYAIEQGERLRVWGDFDVDGQTATSVLVLGLRALGAQVDYTIPHRATHSHGLNKDGLRRAADDGVRVLITCDCGVTDFAETSFARELGLELIVTDHHDLEPAPDAAFRLPDALAVINPKRLPAGHPLEHLPGVGTAYKLIEALHVRMGRGSDDPAALLDLVALGIVADVAYQRGDTRYLLQLGLDRLRRAPRPGIHALMRAAGITPLHFEADDIGYQIGPRLNAAGRLDSAELSVELLTSQDDAHARDLAARLEAINAQRKVLQREVEADALGMLESDPALAQTAVIVLHSPRWHPSLLGVAASSVVNRYRKPAILISVEPGRSGRGSARSIDGVDIHAAIAAQGHLIEGGGGHPRAAGFGIRAENVAAFRRAINTHVEAQLARAESIPPEAVAHRVAWRDVGLPLAEELDRLAPFGAGNPRPLLRSDGLRFIRAEPLGKDGRHQMLYLQDANGTIGRAAWWHSAGRALPEQNDDVALSFTLKRDVFNDRARAQVTAQALEFEGRRLELQGDDAQRAITVAFVVHDLRAEADRVSALLAATEAHGRDLVQVWSHAAPPPQLAEFDGWVNRARLHARPVLMIWDAPPGPAELADGLARARPQIVLLACRAGTGQESAEEVLNQVAAMIETSKQRGDSVDDPAIITRMAARINQREDTVRAAIEAIRAGVAAGAAVMPRLRYLLEETRAYRTYASQAPAAEVLRTG